MARLVVVLVALAVALASLGGAAYALGQWPSAPYAYPSSSWVGQLLYGSNNNTHTGADLWGTQNGAGSQGPSAYSAYGGTVANLWWLCDKGGGQYDTRNCNCAGSPGVLRAVKYGVTIHNDDGLVTHNWHMADQATFSSWVNPDLAVGQWRAQGTWLGWQGNATGVGTVLLHFHITVGTNPNRDCCMSESLDPTPYIGPNLRNGSPEVGNWYAYNGP